MELGNRLRKHRQARGISQEALAQELYVSRQTISNWETGKTYPDIENILLLAQFYGSTLDDLVRGDVDEMERHIQAEAERLDRLGRAMLMLMAVAIVGALGWLAADQRMAAVAWGVALWLVAMACALQAERIKRANDLVTYAEIRAFMEGEEPVREAGARTWARRAASVAAKLGAGGLLGIPLVVGTVIRGAATAASSGVRAAGSAAFGGFGSRAFVHVPTSEDEVPQGVGPGVKAPTPGETFLKNLPWLVLLIVAIAFALRRWQAGA